MVARGKESKQAKYQKICMEVYHIHTVENQRPRENMERNQKKIPPYL
jgi:hypothetical protein